MYQMQVQLAGLPITLVLLSDGTAVFVPMVAFSGILDQNKGQVNAWFYDDEFYIFGTDGVTIENYSYRVAYALRDYPLLVEWLKSLKLQLP